MLNKVSVILGGKTENVMYHQSKMISAAFENLIINMQ